MVGAPARRIAAYYAIERGIPQRRACALMQVARSSLKYVPTMPQANELAAAAAEQQCSTLMDRHRSRAGLAGRVRGELVRSIAELPDMDAVSSALCMTPRTLRRHLLEEGTTFLKLRDEVRLTLAEEFLTNFALSIEQIAQRLGYSEPTCFINAFKRWTGTTPLAYRRQREGFGAVHYV